MKILPARNVYFATAFACALMVGASAQAQDAEADAQAYAALLQQIENVKLGIAGQQAKISTQEKTAAMMAAQLESIPAVKEKIRPLIAEMTAEMEKEIQADLPFRATERYNRLDNLKEKIADQAIGESELYRLAINMYDIEANYGNSISAYTGNNPVNPGGRLAACRENIDSAKCALTDDQADAISRGATLDDDEIKNSFTDGNYVHFGRMALVYLELDSSIGYRYDMDSKSWITLENNDIIDTRRAVRVARGESAPSVLTGPVRITAAKLESGLSRVPGLRQTK